MLTADQEQAMRRDGFFTVRLIDEAEAAGLRDRLVELRGSEDFAPPSCLPLDHHSSYLESDRAYRERSFQFIGAALNGPVTALLGDYEAVSATLVIKEPGRGALRLHCDPTMTLEEEGHALGVWCPLVDVDDDNGTLRVVPGSHRVPHQTHGPTTASAFYTPIAAELMARSVAQQLRAGEAVIYRANLLHWSKVNTSSAYRPALSSNYVPRTARPVFYRLCPERDVYEVFDMSGGGYFATAPEDLLAGRVRGPKLCERPNRNRPLSLAEFDRHMRRADSADRGGILGALRSLLPQARGT